MSHEYRMEQLRAAIAAARKNFKKDANFFVVGLTYGCRRSWNRSLLQSARFSTVDSRFCIVTGSVGESSLTGEGNIHREVQEFR